jgi:hypothetical protein
LGCLGWGLMSLICVSVCVSVGGDGCGVGVLFE